MVIRAIIWDMGGVLVRTEDFRPREALAARLGMSRGELEKVVFNHDSGDRAQRGEIEAGEHWENVMRFLNLPVEAMHEFRREFFGADRVDYELIRAIHGLRPRYRTGLLSNAFDDLRHFLTERWKFADAFDDLVISAEVGVIKPAERIYHMAVERLGVAPEQAVFIDDFFTNVDGARRAGLQAIHFQTPRQTWDELERLLKEAGE